MRAAMNEVDPDSWLVAEHCHDASLDLPGDGWQGTMNYAGFTRPLWSWLRSDEHGLPILGVPGPVPRQPGPSAVATMREVASAMPWQSMCGSFTLLDSHDSARVASAVESVDAHLAAVGLMAAFPGVPMVFAGSEVGCRGDNGDAARSPFPWDQSKWDHTLYNGHCAALATRASSNALRHGGLRWLDVDDDHIAFARETQSETVVVEAWRSGGSPPTIDGDIISEYSANAGYRWTRL
jgi:alpha-glucosidase